MMALDPRAARLFEPTPVPSFWQYLWEKNPWVYCHVPVSLLTYIATFVFGLDWWMSIIIGLLFGLSVGNATESWSLWRQHVRFAREAAKRVDELSTGERGFPRPLAQAIVNLINEDKVSAAAALALEHMQATDPQAKARMDEFNALPEDEKKRRTDGDSQ